MRVLFVTYPQVRSDAGGLQIQIEKSVEGLRRLGVDVVRYDPWTSQIGEVDIVHIFSSKSCNIGYAEQAGNLGKGVVVSSVLSCFSEKAWRLKMKVRLSQTLRGVLSHLRESARLLRLADRVIALNGQERKLLLSGIGLESGRCVVIPNGISKRFSDGDRDVFKGEYGVEDFVLEVGSIWRCKNQLSLIRAMKDSEHCLVIVGGALSGHNGYESQCKAEAGDNVIFTGHIAHDDPLLAGAFAGAKLFVLPSYSEVMPLTLYEAALAGCKLIASRNFPVAEEIVEYVPRVDPDDTKGLGRVISEQMESAVDTRLQEAVAAMPDWLDVAKSIKGVYEDVLREKMGG